ncbi:hypothetical protein V8B97DRAFT_2025174 [Scleroderma yunnanense]
MPLSVNRVALIYAILAAVHPSLATCRAISLSFPAELHSLICDHLFTSVANDLLRSLQESLYSALSTLCEDCKAYNAHIFGPCVIDWPCMHTGARCLCATIGVSAVNPCSDCRHADENLGFALPFGTADPHLPAYIVKHVRDTLAAYAAIDPHFPYSTYPLASRADLNSFLSSALKVYDCAMEHLSTTQWGIDNIDIIIITPCDHLQTTLARLRLTLQLPTHPDTVPLPLTYLRIITYENSVPSPGMI